MGPRTQIFLWVHKDNDVIPPRRWVPEARRYRPNTPIILCGNKSDEWRLVSYDDAKALGKEVGAEMVLECSARTGEGLKELYRHAVNVGLRGRAMRGITRGMGYRPTSLWNTTCKRCGQLSKQTCKCERTLTEVSPTDGF